MIPPVTRHNRVDGRGRRGTNCGEKNQNNGTQRQQRPNFPRIGKNILKLAKLTDTLFPGIPLVLILIITQAEGGNPHEPFKWELISWEGTRTIATFSNPGPPEFIVKLCDLVSIHCEKGPPFYICPASGPSYCNYPGHYYCGYLGCETIASGWSVKASDKYIKATWTPNECVPELTGVDLTGLRNVDYVAPRDKEVCTYIKFQVLHPLEDKWLVGRTWGIRVYGGIPKDLGGHFLIRKVKIPHDSLPVGPNKVLNLPTSPTKKIVPTSVITTRPNSLSVTDRITNDRVTVRDSGVSKSKDPLWDLMQASYHALNESKPNITKECWSCYNVRPPYFEAIGKPDKIQWSSGSNPRECPWNDQKNHTQGITIQLVKGQGKCIGTVPKDYWPLCNQTTIITTKTIERHKKRNDKWAIPAPGAKWVCSDTGVTPCLSLKVFDQSQFCIQVIIVPRLIYHTSEEVLRHFEGDLNIQKREPITVVTLATLLIAGGVGTGTGIASLVKSQELQSLQMAVDEDLAKIEQSIQNLATSVKSLSEVVLQNRRGLDLLFLKEGGLCIALNEECCSFADHTGVVQDTMSELRKRLNQRKRDREAGRSWYENWFNVSPWLTTLLSALAGPLIILILGLIFGPCILRCILHYVKKLFDIAKLLILTTRSGAKYKSASIDEDEDCCECVVPRGGYAYCNCKVLPCECYDKCWDCGKRFICNAESESSI
ncbi:MLV-related proviral Env polyprotein-like [Lonchura striata]